MSKIESFGDWNNIYDYEPVICESCKEDIDFEEIIDRCNGCDLLGDLCIGNFDELRSMCQRCCQEDLMNCYSLE